MIPQIAAAGIGGLFGGPLGAIAANRAVAAVQGAGFIRDRKSVV